MTDEDLDRYRRFPDSDYRDEEDWTPADNRRPVPSLPHWVAAFCLWAAIMLGAGSWWLGWW